MTVLVYRHDLLPYSETFVLEQAGHLRRYRPYFAGLRRVEGLPVPEGRSSVAHGEARLFAVTGRWPKLVARLRGEDVRVVHAHFEGGGIAALGLARDLGVPLVTTCHGWDVTVSDEARWPNPVLRKLYQFRRRKLQREGALFIAVSEHIRRKMIALGYPEGRTVVHYIGVDTERFRPDPAVRREPVVLFTGRLVEKKGCAHLIEAMAALPEGARLVIVGDGPLRKSLEELAARVFPGAEFLGVQPGEAVRQWMNRARVFCVPTVRAANGDMDGCPFVFFEAQAMGLPVVSFASGGTPEAVIHGETGLLAAEGDTAGLGAMLTRIWNDGAEWTRLSAAGRARVELQFSIRRQCEALEQIYDEVAAKWSVS